MCYLSPSGTWYCTQFLTWAESFMGKCVKLAPICREFVKMSEKWPKIACFWQVPREPAMCHLSPSGISKFTLFPVWAKSFVGKFVKLAPTCQGSAKKCEKWPQIGRCLVNQQCATLVLSAYQTRQCHIPASKILWAYSKNWLQYSHWSWFFSLAESLYCD